jgi:hypothetical protein
MGAILLNSGPKLGRHLKKTPGGRCDTISLRGPASEPPVPCRACPAPPAQ